MEQFVGVPTDTTTIDQSVSDEIIEDCRKKAAGALRACFADQVRAVMTACRKKLNVKASLTAETDSSHSQRHLNNLVDLLGSWSNIASDIRSLGMSSYLLRIILSPLHQRVVEVAAECFQKFQQDKQVDKVQQKLLLQGSSIATKVEAMATFHQLDSLLSQMAAMRDIVNQYYAFIRSATSMEGEEDVDTCSETNRWRELDAVYVALEYSYLDQAVKDALTESSLLEVESSSVLVPQAVEDVLFLLQKGAERSLSTGSEQSIFAVGGKIIEVLDAKEDGGFSSFLITRRIFRNCISSRRVNLSRLNKPQQRISSQAINATETWATPAKPSKDSNIVHLAQGMTTPTPQLNAPRADGAFLSPALTEENLDGSFIGGGPLLGGVTQWLGGFSSPAAYSPNAQVPSSSSKGRSILNAFDEFIGFNENEAIVADTKTLSRGATNSSKNVATSIASPLASPMLKKTSDTVLGSIDQLIISALEDDAADYDSDADSGEDVVRGVISNNFTLSFEDASVQLNALAATPKAIHSLAEYFYSAAWHGSQKCSDDFNPASSTATRPKKQSPVELTVQELKRCEAEYSLAFRNATDYFVSHFFANALPHLREVLAKNSYEISGDVMEKRTGLNEFARETKSAIANIGVEPKQRPLLSSSSSSSFLTSSSLSNASGGDNGIMGAGRGPEMMRIRERLSHRAYCQVISHIASLLDALLVEWILETHFTEWGALLIHDEFLALLRLFDQACEDTSSSILFERVLWATKILTIDQPADMMRYRVPARLFGEAEVRRLLGRRTDLSQEAVAKVKLNIIDM